MINSFPPDVLLHPDPLHKPLPKQQNVNKVIPINQNTGINLDIEENSPFQEGIISKKNTETGQNIFSKPRKGLKIS